MTHAIDLLIRYGYVVVFGVVLAEQIGLPVPSQLLLVGAGGLAGNGRLNPFLVLVAGAFASLIGDSVWYGIGRAGGPRVLRWICRISLEPDSCVRRTHGLFGTCGAWYLVFAKFVPGISTVAPPLAGITGMSLYTFLAISTIAGLVWAGVFIALGWVFSSQLEVVGRSLEGLGSWAFAVVAGAIVAYVAYKYIMRQLFLRKLRIARITPAELKSMLDAGGDVMVVDVRDRLDFQTEPSIIPGALHLSTDELEARHLEIPRERDIILYCT
jgi:membrane protein DedA with SNARE-associated domain